MATFTEVERKYEVPLGFVLPDLTALPGVAAVADPAELRLDALYFDTPGLRLTGNKVTLRRRTGGHDEGWHLKLPAGSDRTEIQEPLGEQPGQVPASLARQVRALTRGEPLNPVARVRTRRLEREVRDANGDVLALLADDVVASEALMDPAVVQQWREVEVELVNGPRSIMDSVDERLRAAGARPSQASSKLARALGEHYPTPSGESCTGRASRSLFDYVTAQRDAIVQTYPGVLADDVEAVHDMRVATRRLRATLKTFAPLLPDGYAEPLEAELRWLGGVLGAVRDGHVMSDRLARAIAAEPPELVVGPVAARIRERVAASAERARADLHAALDGPRFVGVLNQLDQFIEKQPRRSPVKRTRRYAAKAVRRADRRLDWACRAQPTATPMKEGSSRDAQLHDARKAYKRARYAVEVLRPAAGRPARRLVKQLTALQDLLGGHQDSVVTGQLLRDYGMRAYLEGDNAFSYGLLHARQRAEGEQLLTQLPRARRRANAHSVRDWLG